jgi:hypothetical protein
MPEQEKAKECVPEEATNSQGSSSHQYRNGSANGFEYKQFYKQQGKFFQEEQSTEGANAKGQDNIIGHKAHTPPSSEGPAGTEQVG